MYAREGHEESQWFCIIAKFTAFFHFLSTQNTKCTFRKGGGGGLQLTLDCEFELLFVNNIIIISLGCIG